MLGKLIANLFRRGPRQNPELATETARIECDNPIAEYFLNTPGGMKAEWRHYFDIFHRHFSSFRERSPVVLITGVWKSEMPMWRHYFGFGARVIGINLVSRTIQLSDEMTVQIMVGGQGDRDFLADVRRQVPHIDIVIDDGRHTMAQQIITFEELYAHIQPDGIYLREDMHASFSPEFGGGYRQADTFLEYGKALVDRLHAWHSRDPATLTIDNVTKSTCSLHFYNSVLVLEKRPKE